MQKMRWMRSDYKRVCSDSNLCIVCWTHWDIWTSNTYITFRNWFQNQYFLVADSAGVDDVLGTLPTYSVANVQHHRDFPSVWCMAQPSQDALAGFMQGLKEDGNKVTLWSMQGLKEDGNKVTLWSMQGLKQDGNKVTLWSMQGLKQDGNKVTLWSMHGLKEDGNKVTLWSVQGLKQDGNKVTLWSKQVNELNTRNVEFVLWLLP